MYNADTRLEVYNLDSISGFMIYNLYLLSTWLYNYIIYLLEVSIFQISILFDKEIHEYLPVIILYLYI